MVRIKINEREASFDHPPKLMEVRARFKPDADLVILNGFPETGNPVLRDGDGVVLIKRGERPTRDELEHLMTARHSPGVHEKIRRSRVGIAGLGGLGSSVAVALARIGVGALVIADYDVVEPSNLNRQQYFIDQIGVPKVHALEANLRRINPYVGVVKHNVFLDASNIPEIFCRADVLVEAFDSAEMKALLINTMARSCPDVPVVAASGLAGYGPSNDIKTQAFSARYYVVGDLLTEAASGTGLMAPRVGIAAHHQANCVLRILIGEDAGLAVRQGNGGEGQSERNA